MLTRAKSLLDRQKGGEQGFTLIEVLVVMLVMGVLAAIAIPSYLGHRKAAIDATVETDVRNAAGQIESWMVDHHSSLVPVETYRNKGGGTTAFISPYMALAAEAGSAGMDRPEIKTTKDNVIVISNTGVKGSYCVFGINPAGDKAARVNGVTYDSTAGGMNKLELCGSFVPSEVTELIPNGGSNAGGGTGGGEEIPEDNQMTITDGTNGDKILVQWQFVKRYAMNYGTQRDYLEFTLTRKSDGQPVNGTMYHMAGFGNGSGGWSLVENGKSLREATREKLDPTSVDFKSGALEGAGIHSGAPIKNFGFTARLEMANQAISGSTSPDSVSGSIQVYGSNARTPDSVGGNLNIAFPAGAEGRKTIDIEAMSSGDRPVWEARGFMRTGTSSSADFHTTDIKKGVHNLNNVAYYKVTVTLENNNFYTYTTN